VLEVMDISFVFHKLSRGDLLKSILILKNPIHAGWSLMIYEGGPDPLKSFEGFPAKDISSFIDIGHRADWIAAQEAEIDQRVVGTVLPRHRIFPPPP
jgi:hypothetical protein